MLEVFQDLKFSGLPKNKLNFRRALLESITEPWAHDKERESRLEADTEDDVLVFVRNDDGTLPTASLILWEESDGYKVTNIVPLKISSLSYGQYNEILRDFVERAGKEAGGRVGFTIEISKPYTTIEDYLSSETAQALRRFSVLANKSTGASHPLDERRWFDFLVKAYSDGSKLDAHTLARLLVEDEKWPQDIAHNLAGEYEKALHLLEFYNNHQS